MTFPEINVQQLMQQIREELNERADQSTAPSFGELPTELANPDLYEIAASLRRCVSDVRTPVPVRLSLPEPSRSTSQPDIRVAEDGAFQLQDFVQYEGEAFVRAAFRALLRREVDEEGFHCYLTMLEVGASKAEVLGKICESAEARSLDARVSGLALPYVLDTVRRWPIIGRIVGIFIAIWHLPEGERRLRQMTVASAQRVARIEQDLARTTESAREALRTLQDAQNSMADTTRIFASRAQFEALQRAFLKTIASLDAIRTTHGSIVLRSDCAKHE